MWKIKGRGWSDGRKQREYITKDETISPNVATEALLLTFLIYYIKHCHGETADIPGTFMQAKMEGETVQIKMEGNTVDILTKAYPKLY